MFVNGDLKGKFIMDRNLGAREVKSTRYEYRGVLHYQCGRKDPFPGGEQGSFITVGYNGRGADNWEVEAYSTDVNGQVEISTSVNSPMIFYSNSYGNTNWCSAVDSETYVWNDFETDKDNNDKSIFDPSPLGWKIAPYGTHDGFSTDETCVWEVDSDEIGRAYPSENPIAFYPAVQGYRNSNGGGINDITGGFYYYSTPASTLTTYRFMLRSTFWSGGPGVTVGRSFGMSLRCVQHYE